MTKLRHPLTFERALARIAGLIGWDKAAAIVGQAERTVRNWSDPEAMASIRMDAALKLDIAYQEAGGDGAPMWQCYSTRLEIETVQVLFSGDAIAISAARAAKEVGEAISAAIDASRNGAEVSDRLIAIRETEEGIEAFQNMLAKLRAGLGDQAQPEGDG